MKISKNKLIVALAATATITMSLAATAFAAPAGTTTKPCPKTQAIQKQLSQNGISLPTGTSLNLQELQKLLNQFGINLPTTGTAKTPATTTTPAPSSAPATGTSTGSTAPVSGSMSADESKMINLVNQDRANNGLKPLTFDAGLRSGALLHSQDMSENNYFSHTSPTYGTFTQRIKDSGVKYTSAGENIAMYGSVESAEVGFMNSPGHRANILGDFTRVGIGIVYNQSKGSYYITQWFAK